MTTEIVADVQLPAGFLARPIEPDRDAQAVLDLCTTAALAEYGTSDLTYQMARESYNTAGFHAATDARIVVDANGATAGLVEYYDTAEGHVAPFVYVRVRPDLLETGIGEALLRWAEVRGVATLPFVEPGLRMALHASAAGVNTAMQGVFERSGWETERVFWTMEIELGDEPPASATLPDGITLRTTVEGVDEPSVYAAEVETFADHFGYLPRSYETWLQWQTAMYSYDPSLWFLAVDGDEIAGFSLCLREAPGRPDVGWVSVLGVRRPWRGRGLGQALLQHSFRELHHRGQRRVGLGVDSQNLTGATRLYERVGMRVVRDGRSYERVLREGKEIRPT